MATPTTWSHSQINTLFECGEAYRLEKVAKAPRMPAWWFVGGSAFHGASEIFDRRLFRGELMSEEELLEVWEKCWEAEIAENSADFPDTDQWFRGGRATKAAPNREDGVFLHEQGRIWIVNYRDWRLENPNLEILALTDDEPAIEISFMAEFAGQMFRGGVDRVFVDVNTGIPLVVDHKTGSRVPENDNQLCEYAHALRKLLGLDIEYGAYYMAREKRLREPVRLSMSLAEFENNIRVATVLRDNKAYAARKSNRCKACGVNRFCASYGGAEAHLYEGITE